MIYKMTEQDYRDRSSNNEGICTTCHEEYFGIEPDGHKYLCEECGSYSVYGLEELLMMGAIEFEEDAE